MRTVMVHYLCQSNITLNLQLAWLMKPLFIVIEVYIRLKNGLSIDPVILCDDDEDTLLRMKSIKESFLRWDFDNDCKGFINLASTVLMKRDSQEEYRKNKDGDCRSEKTVGSEHIADMSTDFARESDQDAAMMDASVMSRDDESAHDRILNAASASVKKADVAITRMSAIFDSLEASSSERPSILRKLQACVSWSCVTNVQSTVTTNVSLILQGLSCRSVAPLIAFEIRTRACPLSVGKTSCL
uniref:DNA mismatch repair proteins mutS family domain-containing protein n=1 Tax=Parascaris univalens TaxID=6257 RepID=A0A915A2L5_PARUN